MRVGLIGMLVAAGVAAPTAVASTRSTLAILYPTKVGSVDAAAVITEARALGLRTVRFSQDVATPSLRPAFNVFARQRMDLVLTLNNEQRADATGHRPGRPPVGTTALKAYQRRVARVLDRVARVKLVQIENEEIEPNFYSGTMARYVAELNAAVTVAHRRGLRVTNGGITTRALALLVWEDYRKRGLFAQADDFAGRVFTEPTDRATLRDLRRRPFRGLSRERLQAAWDRARQLIPAFRRSRMDYVNFHWYRADDRALREAVTYLRRATHKTVVTTEIGQYDTSPSVVTGHLRSTVELLRLPFVVWFDADGIPAHGLHDAPGQLRPNGQAFKSYVAARRTRVQ